MHDVLLLLLLLLIAGKSASWAVRSAISLSHIFGWSEFIVSFFIITAISVLPETIISVLSAWNGIPALGLGTLLGSNVADLTFVFGIVALLTPHNLKVESAFIKKDYLFLAFLLLPLVLGFTGYYSRLDGIILILASVIFFCSLLRGRAPGIKKLHDINGLTLVKSIVVLVLALLVMTSSAYYVVHYAAYIATGFAVSPALIGLLVIALGTTLPELLFSARAARKAHTTLVLGDILGTVIADATFVLGITAVIHPFSFNPRLIILTGFFMLLAGIVSLSFLRSGRTLTKPEGGLLLVFYAVFVMVEFILRDWTPLITR